MKRIAAAALWLAAACWLDAQQDPWFEWNKAAGTAYRQKDYTALRRSLLKMAAAAPGQPDVVYKLAAAEALAGHRKAALAGLRRFVELGQARAVETDPDFASLRGTPELARVLHDMEENRRPVSNGELVYTLPAGLLTEDIAYDPATRSFYVSSIRKRKIVRIGADGQVSDFAVAGDDAWGILALAVDSARRVLWATTCALPQAEGYRAGDDGRAAVLEYDLGSGKLLRRHDPPGGERHSFGDMTLDGDGNAIVADSLGSVHRVRRDGGAIETVVAPGIFTSAQTPAVAPDGRIFVADYGRGVGIIEPGTRRVSWLEGTRHLALSGIDGLYLKGYSLIAVQNGTDPQRLIWMDLDSSLRRVTGWKIAERNTPLLTEPTHGVLVGDEFYYIGRSGWDEWAEDGTRKPGAEARPPLIVRLKSAQVTMLK